MNTEELRAFVAAVEHKSLTRAAAALHLSQPAVTRRIRNLEESLGGQQLLDRESKPPRVTPLGQRIYEQCKSVLRELEALRTLSQEDTPPRGLLRIGVAQIVGGAVLVDSISRVKAAFPAVDIRIYSDWSSRLLQHVETGAAEVAAVLLHPGAALPAGVTGQRVAELEVVVVRQKDGGGRAKLKFDDLAAVGWILNPEGCSYRAALERQYQAAGGKLNVAVDVVGIDLQLAMAARGLGYGFVPRHMLAASRYRSALQIVPVKDLHVVTEVWAVRREVLGNLAAPARVFGNSLEHGFEKLAETPSARRSA